MPGILFGRKGLNMIDHIIKKLIKVHATSHLGNPSRDREVVAFSPINIWSAVTYTFLCPKGDITDFLSV